MKSEKRIYRLFLIMAIILMAAGIFLIYFADKDITLSEHPITKRASMFMWIVFTYMAIVAFLIFIEKYYTNAHSQAQTYKDATISFSHMTPLLKDEAEILKTFKDMSDDKIYEISLVYNLSEYFKLQGELEELLKKHPSSNAKAEVIIHKEKEIEDFVFKFRKSPRSYYTGKGFVTFHNFKRAKIFKDNHNRAYNKLSILGAGGHTNKIAENLKHAVYKIALLKSLNKTDGSVLPERKTFAIAKTRSSTTEDEISKSKRRYSGSVIKTISNILGEQKKYIDEEKVQRMPSLLGPKFKIKRGIDPSLINFKFGSIKKITYMQIISYTVCIMLVMPSLAYYFNYLYYKYEILIYLEHFQNTATKILKYVFLIATVAIDQMTFSFLAHFFSKERFTKTTHQFLYTMTFTSFYLLLSNIVMPNFALKKAFLDITPLMNFKERKSTLEHLISTLYFNYYILIFSMVNFKILKPLILDRIHKTVTNDNSAFQNIVFGISFIINSIFYVAFYGTLTPSVFIYFFVTMLCAYASESLNQLKLFNISAQAASKKTDQPTKEEAQIDILEAKTEKIPMNVFSIALIILATGIFPLSCLGYYGITKDIDYFLNLADPRKHGYIATAFIYSEYLLDKFYDLLVWPFYFVPSITPSVFGTIKKTLFSIIVESTDKFFEDEVLMFFTITYFVFLALFLYFNHTERFLSRLQSRLWKVQKVAPAPSFHGKSYREVNPAYAILNK